MMDSTLIESSHNIFLGNISFISIASKFIVTSVFFMKQGSKLVPHNWDSPYGRTYDSQDDGT